MAKKEALQEWERLYGKPVSEEEYREICNNLYGFFTLLDKWDKESSPTKKNNETLSE